MSPKTAALWLATQHALRSGIPKAWAWAVANFADSTALADLATTQRQVYREMAQAALLATDGANDVLALFLVGPPPAPEAAATEHLAYLRRVVAGMTEYMEQQSRPAHLPAARPADRGAVATLACLTFGE